MTGMKTSAIGTGCVAAAVVLGLAAAGANAQCFTTYSPYYYTYPAPVMVAPAPVVVAPAPVIYAPPPVYSVPVPVYYAPRHVSFGFGYSSGGHRIHSRPVVCSPRRSFSFGFGFSR